jgi:hypothetical protein
MILVFLGIIVIVAGGLLHGSIKLELVILLIGIGSLICGSYFLGKNSS